MKIRSGFVSNSSSASFILDKRYISYEDIEKIIDYCNTLDEEGNWIKSECLDTWTTVEDENFLKGFTSMDNGELFSWIKENLDIPLKAFVDFGEEFCFRRKQ